MATATESLPRAGHPKQVTDILVQSDGTIYIFYAESAAGRDWLEENIGHAQPWGDGFAVEHPYAFDICEGATGDGLIVRATR